MAVCIIRSFEFAVPTTANRSGLKNGAMAFYKKPDKWRFGFNRQGVRNAGIPVFYCPDLRIAKGREMVQPIFFSLEDLYYAWDRSTAGKHGAAPGDVKTLDFLRVIEWMLNEPDQTKLVGFHASTQAQDYVEAQLKVKGGKSRPIRAS